MNFRKLFVMGSGREFYDSEDQEGTESDFTSVGCWGVMVCTLMLLVLLGVIFMLGNF